MAMKRFARWVKKKPATGSSVAKVPSSEVSKEVREVPHEPLSLETVPSSRIENDININDIQTVQPSATNEHNRSSQDDDFNAGEVAHFLVSPEDCKLCIANTSRHINTECTGSLPAITSGEELTSDACANSEIVNMSAVNEIHEKYANVVSVQERRILHKKVIDTIQSKFLPYYDFCVISSEYDYERAQQFKMLLSRAFSLNGCMLHDGFSTLGADLFESYETMIDHSTKVMFFLTNNFCADNFCRRIQNGVVFQSLMSCIRQKREKCVPVLGSRNCHIPLPLSCIAGIVPRNHDALCQVINTTFSKAVIEGRKLKQLGQKEEATHKYALIFHEEVEAHLLKQKALEMRIEQQKSLTNDISQLSSLYSNFNNLNTLEPKALEQNWNPNSYDNNNSLLIPSMQGKIPEHLGSSLPQLTLIQNSCNQGLSTVKQQSQPNFPQNLSECETIQQTIRSEQYLPYTVNASQQNIHVQQQSTHISEVSLQQSACHSTASQQTLNLQENVSQSSSYGHDVQSVSQSVVSEQNICRNTSQGNLLNHNLNSCHDSDVINKADAQKYNEQEDSHKEDKSGAQTPYSNSPFNNLPIPDEIRNCIQHIVSEYGESNIKIERSKNCHIGHNITFNIYRTDYKDSECASSSDDTEENDSTSDETD